MIVAPGEFPPLGVNGAVPRPMALLLGGRIGTWQFKAARELDRLCGCVVMLDGSPAQLELAEMADVIMIWSGQGDDGLRLHEWSAAAFVAGRWGHKVQAGLAPSSHPMAGPLAMLLEHYGVSCRADYSVLLAGVTESCRKARSHG